MERKQTEASFWSKAFAFVTNARFVIATIAAIVAFMGMALLSFVTVRIDSWVQLSDTDLFKKAFWLLLPSTAAFIGAVIGFFFARSKSK